jgi:hypothetical protein
MYIHTPDTVAHDMSILFGHFSQVIVLENGRNNVEIFCTEKVSWLNKAFRNLL